MSQPVLALHRYFVWGDRMRVHFEDVLRSARNEQDGMCPRKYVPSDRSASEGLSLAGNASEAKLIRRRNHQPKDSPQNRTALGARVITCPVTRTGRRTYG